MGIFTTLARSVFAGWDSSGNPRKINPAEAAIWGTEVERVVGAIATTGAGGLAFDTKSSLEANLGYPAQTAAWVVGDTADNNGIYIKAGGSGTGGWYKASGLPAGVSGEKGDQGDVGPAGPRALTVAYRPGDTPEYYTAALGGAADDLSPAAIGAVVTNSSGKAYRVQHDGTTKTLATRWDMAVEPGVVYALNFAVRRAVDPSEVFGDGVQFGLAWLDNAKALISVQSLDQRPLYVGEGLVTLQRTISRDLAADVTAPASARYMRMFVRLYGSSGSTDVERMNRWETNGLPGTEGDRGDKGWTPAPAAENDGPHRSVLRITDFIGGHGQKPAGAGKYIGAAGLVDTAAEALNIKGNVGPQGQRGITWRGTWNSGASYAVNDVVTDEDSGGDLAAWISLTANADSRPKDNAADWAIFPGSFPRKADYGLITEAATTTRDYGSIV
jgi:hypothetical protein